MSLQKNLRFIHAFALSASVVFVAPQALAGRQKVQQTVAHNVALDRLSRDAQTQIMQNLLMMQAHCTESCDIKPFDEVLRSRSSLRAGATATATVTSFIAGFYLGGKHALAKSVDAGSPVVVSVGASVTGSVAASLSGLLTFQAFDQKPSASNKITNSSELDQRVGAVTWELANFFNLGFDQRERLKLMVTQDLQVAAAQNKPLQIDVLPLLLEEKMIDQSEYQAVLKLRQIVTRLSAEEREARSNLNSQSKALVQTLELMRTELARLNELPAADGKKAIQRQRTIRRLTVSAQRTYALVIRIQMAQKALK